MKTNPITERIRAAVKVAGLRSRTWFEWGDGPDRGPLVAVYSLDDGFLGTITPSKMPTIAMDKPWFLKDQKYFTVIQGCWHRLE